MAIKRINSANEAIQSIKEVLSRSIGDRVQGMTEAEIAQMGIGNTIILLSIIRSTADPNDPKKHITRRLFYKLHDVPPAGQYRSTGTNYVWIPYFKSNNAFIKPHDNICGALKYVFSNDLNGFEEVVICDTQEEMCEYILAKLRAEEPIPVGV